ncbi:hypothetical protein LMS58_001587 [Listeria monocytogenes]|nr:hypothetical protein [Listeria monocytogenes]EIM1738567.1 hypothetical protein [Listeria monocytogenes]EIM1741374.1 hypothetical protein [Listeria monocytogenes]
MNLLNHTVKNIDTDTMIFDNYYFVDGDNFILKEDLVEYTLSFEKTKIIKRRVISKTDKQFLIGNSQDEKIFRDEKGWINYSDEKQNRVELLDNKEVKGFIATNKKNILIYDELKLLTYKNLHFKEKYRIPEGFMLRKSLFLTEEVLVLLLNEKKNILKNIIETYQI